MPKVRERPVGSPCVSICALDENDICIGCQRTGDEILYWTRMNNEERRAVLSQLDQRAAEQGLKIES